MAYLNYSQRNVQLQWFDPKDRTIFVHKHNGYSRQISETTSSDS